MIGKTLRIPLHFWSSFRLLNRAMATTPSPLVIVLTGATSVGKSAVANELCQIIDAEIVIADSVQVFKHLDIGSNKPTESDQQTVPHHLLDIFNPSDEVSAEDFCKKATIAINDIISRNKVPIVVGGSTMWVQWLVHGKPDAPGPTADVTEQARSMLREVETEKNWYAAVDIVREYDPIRVDKIAKNDWYRLRRYLEVGLSLRKVEGVNDDKLVDEDVTLSVSDMGSSFLTGQRTPYLNGMDVRCFFLGEQREDLYRTIDERCKDMLTGGLLQEVSALLEADILLPEHPVSKAIGYRQTIDYLLQRDRDDMDAKLFGRYIEEFASATRQYAKRQLAWYRKDPLFLCLRIKRRKSVQQTSSDPMLPYTTVCEEILHWVQQTPQSFESQVQRQVNQGHEYTRLMTVKHFDFKYEIQSELEREIMCRMICDGFLTLPNAKNPRADSDKVKKARSTLAGVLKNVAEKNVAVVEPVIVTTPKWVISILDPAQGVTPSAMAEKLLTEETSQWTADEPDVRSTETANKNSKMRAYRSVLSDERNISIMFNKVIQEADECRHVLLREKPELVERYRAQKESGAVNRHSD